MEQQQKVNDLQNFKNSLIAKLEEKMKELNIAGKSEYEYCAITSRIDTLFEVINMIKND